MGYYSTLTIDTCMKEECIDDVFKLYAKINAKIADETAEDWENELSWFQPNEDGYFDCDDWYAKWYKDNEWITRLAPFLQDGDIELVGEDGERWGYRIENGIVYDLIFEKRKGEPVK